MHLKSGTLLKSGSYKIEKVLGQGGFGITYLAVQTGLNRKVAVKEFFMKEHCNRDESSYVSVPSVGSKSLVEKFRLKFIKEAQTIADMDNAHIVRIHDVFEENGTAYYVMEFLSGGSLSDRIPKSGLPEPEALNYIRQVGEALAYIHENNILHLDIKPSNILFRKADEAVLIDFGISKHYDEAGGAQTSSTPVGVSEGYAPTEQYENEGVSSFSASTDIYALGATLYCLLVGTRPPKASIVLNDGLPPLPKTVSISVCEAIEKAMSPKRKDRPQSVAEFMALLDAVEGEEETLPPPPPPPPLQPQPDPKPRNLKWLWALLAGIVAAVVMFFVFKDRPTPEPEPVVEPVVTQEEVVQEALLASQWESDLQKYQSLVEMGLEYSKNDATLSQAKSKLTEAVSYERKYKNSSYSGKFSKNASGLLKTVENRQSELAEAERAAAAADQAEADRLAQEQKVREQREREEAERKRNETSYKDGVLKVKGIEYPMVYVSGGSFDMGATAEQVSDEYRDKNPVHRVTLSSYRIGKYEVTQDLWEAVMGSNPSGFKGLRKPVESVSWNDCQEFIRKLNDLTGANFRLPTEAEWEFAARGGNGSQGYEYSGGNWYDDVLWCRGNSNYTTHNVGMKSPNELGLYDMSGNVREWCNDWFGDYSSSTQKNPKGPSNGSHRVYRGGCYSINLKACCVYFRGGTTPGSCSSYLGFRLCL